MADVFAFNLPRSTTKHPSAFRDFVTVTLKPFTDEVLHQKELSPEVFRLAILSHIPYSDILKEQYVQDFQLLHGVELVLLPRISTISPSAHRPLRLAVFDLDSTLIEQEVIDELAATIGAGEAVAAITERAMRGELDFAASLEARVRLLEGVRADVWETLKQRITFAEGARELCRALKRLGVKMAVFSGGFMPIAEWVKGELGLDRAVANQLCTSPPTEKHQFPHLTGELEPDTPVVTAAGKRELLEEFAKEHHVPLSEALCVGDGANDLHMIRAVGNAGGIGIAFKAKERVQRRAPNRLNTSSLLDLLYLTGRDEQEIQELITA